MEVNCTTMEGMIAVGIRRAITDYVLNIALTNRVLHTLTELD